MPYKNRDDRKRWDARNKERRREYLKPYVRADARRRRSERRAFLDKLKAVPCALCGNTYPPYVMDFHHRDPSTKKFPMNVAANCSLELLLAEVAKCDVLCANCHRVVTHSEAEL